MTNQNPDPIVAPGIVEQLLRAHYGLVFDLRAENKELKVKLAQATATSELASKNADSWFASREEYWGRAQSAEKKLSDAEDELRKTQSWLAHANVQVEKAERELSDAKKKLFKEDQQVESLLEQLADMNTELMQLKQDVKEAMAGCEGSYVLTTEAFRKIRFLVASDETYVPQDVVKPEGYLSFRGMPMNARLTGSDVTLKNIDYGGVVKVTADNLKPLGEYLLAVHYFNEAGGNDEV